MTPYVPKPQRGSSVSNGFFREDEFRYDAERDAFICPAGQVLSTRYESKLRELTKIDYSNRAACLVCAIKSRCTKDYRKVPPSSESPATMAVLPSPDSATEVPWLASPPTPVPTSLLPC